MPRLPLAVSLRNTPALGFISFADHSGSSRENVCSFIVIVIIFSVFIQSYSFHKSDCHRLTSEKSTATSPREMRAPTTAQPSIVDIGVNSSRRMAAAKH